MTDTPGGAPAPADAPIVVNANAARDQAEAGVRQFLLALAAVATALGYTKTAGTLSALLMATGPIAGLVVFVWGQVEELNCKVDWLVSMQRPINSDHPLIPSTLEPDGSGCRR